MNEKHRTIHHRLNEAADRAQESRVRREAKRQGLALRKDRSRWEGPGVNIDHLGGWMIVDVSMNTIVAGERYDLGIDDVERFLRS